MLLKMKRDRPRTVAARLTVLFVILFTLTSAAVFLLAYFSLTSSFDRELDEILRNEAKQVSSLLRKTGLNSIKELFERQADTFGTDKMFYRLFSPKRELIASSDLSGWHGASINSGVMIGLDEGEEAFRTVTIRGRKLKVRVIYKGLENDNIVQIGLLVSIYDVMGKYGWVLLYSIVLMLILGSIMGSIMVKRAMTGIQKVTEAAVRIGDGDLAQRLPMGNKDKEIDDLARAFNEMLGKIEILIAEIREVTSNIAHDLRTPLNRIRGMVEMALTSETGAEEWVETASDVIEECDRLTGMINTMLEIAEANAEVSPKIRNEVNMTDLVRDAVELFQPLAEDEDILMHLKTHQAPLFTKGDLPRLQRAVANLLDNAIKYTPAGGNIRISVQKDLDEVLIYVTDSGPGIADESLPFIFDRFYRGDQSRSTPGHGLGLSLAQAIIRAHGGDVTVRSRPGRGSTFIVSIPGFSGGA